MYYDTISSNDTIKNEGHVTLNRSFEFCFKVVRNPRQKITLLLLKSKSVRVIIPESCF